MYGGWHLLRSSAATTNTPPPCETDPPLLGGGVQWAGQVSSGRKLLIVDAVSWSCCVSRQMSGCIGRHSLLLPSRIRIAVVCTYVYKHTHQCLKLFAVDRRLGGSHRQVLALQTLARSPHNVLAGRQLFVGSLPLHTAARKDTCSVGSAHEPAGRCGAWRGLRLHMMHDRLCEVGRPSAFQCSM